jgi:hypothetical protein
MLIQAQFLGSIARVLAMQLLLTTHVQGLPCSSGIPCDSENYCCTSDGNSFSVTSFADRAGLCEMLTTTSCLHGGFANFLGLTYYNSIDYTTFGDGTLQCYCPSAPLWAIRIGGTHPAGACFDGIAAAIVSGNLDVTLPPATCAANPGTFSGSVPLTWCRNPHDGRRMFRGFFTVGTSPTSTEFEIRGKHSSRRTTPEVPSHTWTVKIGVPGKLDSGRQYFLKYTFTTVGELLPVHTGVKCPE